MNSSRVLVIAYIFPPAGGAGVQRVTKFVKYLPRHGWQPSVLTVANPSVPLFDESFSADIPANTFIRRARTREPGYSTKLAFASLSSPCDKQVGVVRRLMKAAVKRIGQLVLQPDPQILWLPAAIREGKRMLSRMQHHAILATAPPFSSFLVASALSRHSGLPLLLDYRDEWDLTNTYFEQQRSDRWARVVQARMQRTVVRAAKVLIATTGSSAQALERIRLAARSKAEVTWIYNGYDPDDFSPAEVNSPLRNELFRLVYVGTLWTLASATPLVHAVQRLARRAPQLAARLELVFAGRRVGPQVNVLEPLKHLPCRLTESNYVPHSEAVQLLRSADSLCLLQSDLPGAGRVVSAKIFEYLAVRRAILVIAPKGELWDLVQNQPSAACFTPADIEGIVRHLERCIEAHGREPVSTEKQFPALRFDRPSQAKQLAHLLDAYRWPSAAGKVCKH